MPRQGRYDPLKRVVTLHYALKTPTAHDLMVPADPVLGQQLQVDPSSAPPFSDLSRLDNALIEADP